MSVSKEHARSLRIGYPSPQCGRVPSGLDETHLRCGRGCPLCQLLLAGARAVAGGSLQQVSRFENLLPVKIVEPPPPSPPCAAPFRLRTLALLDAKVLARPPARPHCWLRLRPRPALPRYRSCGFFLKSTYCSPKAFRFWNQTHKQSWGKVAASATTRKATEISKFQSN